MRKMLLLSVAMTGMAFAPTFAPAFAQTITTQSPPSSHSSQSMPQSPNSVPNGSATSEHNMAGDNVSGGSTTTTTHHHHHHYHNTAKPAGSSMNDDGQRSADNDAGTGGSEPTSTRASNINHATTRSDVAPRLPNPVTAEGASPNTYLRAADQALASRRSGAAQEALERAETRLLDRASVGSADPQRDASVQAVNEARRNLANGDTNGARNAIRQAMASENNRGGDRNQMGTDNGNAGGNMGLGAGRSNTGADAMGGQNGNGQNGNGQNINGAATNNR